jgi:hypothetical protein
MRCKSSKSVKIVKNISDTNRSPFLCYYFYIFFPVIPPIMHLYTADCKVVYSSIMHFSKNADFKVFDVVISKALKLNTLSSNWIEKNNNW